jgi:hypothetical protein
VSQPIDTLVGLSKILRDREEGGFFIPLPADFRPRRLEQAAREIARRFGDASGRQPSPDTLMQLHLRVFGAWRTTGKLDSLNRRDLRRIPWILFIFEKGPGGWLAGDENFSAEYEKWLRSQAPPSVVVALLRRFLWGYPKEDETREAWRVRLRGLLRKGRSARLDVWWRCCLDYCLLEQKGPNEFARKWSGATDMDGYLADAGFIGELASAEFLRLAVLAAVADFPVQDATNVDLKKLIALVEGPSRALRFAGTEQTVAEALLVPFASRAHPGAERAGIITEVVLRHLGDPRLKAGNKWQGVDRRAQEVLRRWLVGMTLDQFFAILDSTAESHQWEPRKRFWYAYFRSRAFEDAWMVLGRQAEQILRRRTREGGIDHGRFMTGAPGALPSHSVLLLRIGGLTIADGSHSWKCRIWTDRTQQSFGFYQTTYDPSALKIGHNFEKVHLGDWQRDVANFIAKETGVRVQRAEWERPV